MGAYAIRARFFGWSGMLGRLSGSAAVGGVSVVTTFHDALRASPQPALAQFTATVAGVARGVTAAAVGGTGNKTLTFTLAAGNLTAGQQVIINYVRGATASTRLAYADGSEFSNGTVGVAAA